MTRLASNITMSDEQIVKIFSPKFMVDIINSTYAEIFKKNGNENSFLQDKGKYLAFISHIHRNFENLSHDEKKSFIHATTQVIEILKYVGEANEANILKDKLSFLTNN